MSSKPSKFFGLFSRKSKSNKENEHPQQSQEGFTRHQSMRGSSRRNRTSHFEEPDEYLSPSSINPYHSVGKPRAKGPRSCPGGQVSMYEDKYNSSRYDYEPEGRTQRVRHEKFRRSGRDTSEYGSGDPSPIAQAGRHHHYNQSLIEDSEDEDDFNKMCLETERRLHEKLKHSESRHVYYKEQCRRLKQQKEECEGAFHDKLQSIREQNRALVAENQNLQRQNGALLQQLNTCQMQLQNSQRQSMYAQCPPSNGGYSQPGAFNFSLSTPARYGMPPMHIPGSMITPGTSSALETSASGAGEALSQPTDLSFRPSSANFSTSFDSKFGDGKFGVKPMDDEMDEVKHFRQVDASSMGEIEEEQFEIKRSAVSSSSISLKGQESAASLVRQIACDSKGSSSTVVVEDVDAEEKTESQQTMRRTASDGAL